MTETSPDQQTQEAHIAHRIAHILTVFPKVSHSMLQVGLGPQLPSKVWRPILDEMIIEGEVIQETQSLQTPTGRQQTYTILSLNTTE